LNSNFNDCPKFGDVFFASLRKEDHIQGGIRPVVIAQNNAGNSHSPMIGIIPMSSKTEKAKYLPVHVVIPADEDNGLNRDSVVLVEQTNLISSKQLIGRIGCLKHMDLVRIKKAIDIQFPFPAA